MASKAEAKGKYRKADKYGAKADKEKARALAYETSIKTAQKATEAMFAAGRHLKDISKKASSRGQAAVDRYIKKHS